MFYERIYKDKKGIKKSNLIKAVKPFITILEGWEGLTQLEANKVKNLDPSAPKLTHIIIEPSVILIDQIENKYILMPANMYQEAKAILGRKYSKYLITLIKHILKEATLKRKKTKFFNYLDTLSYTLRLDSLIKTQQKARIKRDILNYFEQTKKLGYITKYALVNRGVRGEQVEWTINQAKIKLPASQKLLK
jgi:hypothetical protein